LVGVEGDEMNLYNYGSTSEFTSEFNNVKNLIIPYYLFVLN